MQIVIDISKKLYDRYKVKDHIKRCDIDEFEKALDKCIILPKGHGRLKDVDWIDDNCEHHYSDTDGSWCYAWRDIDNAPTIIEADKEQKT